MTITDDGPRIPTALRGHTFAESPKSGLFNTEPFIKHLAGLSKVAPIEMRTTGQAKG
ncbi:hypothetical protein [Streptomyces rugosispiralis]|uniref:Uncharacterized protein n=1 Tax=Streptomyces rugosispiralis TaxID=2967341 RepID=A0ABT1V116_9ACTN|nr:hypothetical protein [Streptomyces rugosispiralis]MCQ8191082.1 hypothetical protein [Streptomyces rugosispiralis]